MLQKYRLNNAERVFFFVYYEKRKMTIHIHSESVKAADTRVIKIRNLMRITAYAHNQHYQLRWHATTAEKKNQK